MTRTTVPRILQAPPERVFAAVAEPAGLPDGIPAVVRELLTARRAGPGTRFRETRLVRGEEAVTELETTEHDAPQRVRFVADGHGRVRDTAFLVTPIAAGSGLVLGMEARAHARLPKLLDPLFEGLTRRLPQGTSMT